MIFIRVLFLYRKRDFPNGDSFETISILLYLKFVIVFLSYNANYLRVYNLNFFISEVVEFVPKGFLRNKLLCLSDLLRVSRQFCLYSMLCCSGIYFPDPIKYRSAAHKPRITSASILLFLSAACITYLRK